MGRHASLDTTPWALRRCQTWYLLSPSADLSGGHTHLRWVVRDRLDLRSRARRKDTAARSRKWSHDRWWTPLGEGWFCFSAALTGGPPSVRVFLPSVDGVDLDGSTPPALLRAASLRGKGGRIGFLGVFVGVLGFAPPGPLLDEKCARAPSERRAGRPGVWGADVGVCRQFGRREYFFFLSPWMGPCCFFLCLCLQGIRMA